MSARGAQAAWSIAFGALALVGFAIVPALASGTSGVNPSLVGPASLNSGGGIVSAGVFQPPAIGTVTISTGGVSSDPAVVAVSGSTARLLESFDGNLTDLWSSSVLNGEGFTINASSYPSEANALYLGGASMTTENLVVSVAGAQNGIVASPAASPVTIESCVVLLGSDASPVIGIEAGAFMSASPLEPSGSYTITGNTVHGPGSGGVAGGVGVAVAAAGVTVTANEVNGFSAETTTTAGGNTYSSWFEDTQSVGIFAGCAEGASVCTVSSNELSDNSIGLAYALLTASDQSITPASVTLQANTVTGSLAYGLVAEATGASGTSTVADNSFNEAASGAPGAFFLGAAYSVSGNIFVGSSTTGANGAEQGEDSCAAATIGTASVEASDCFNPTTTVALNDNFFEGSNAPYWSSTFPTNPSSSSLAGGEIVTFSENGLPSGTPWSVTIAGTAASVHAPGLLIADAWNGTPSYSIGSVPGYYELNVPSSGTVSVSGAPVTEPTLEFQALSTSQLVITPSCGSTDPSLVAVTGTMAVVQATFDGNLTDYCPNSELYGAGFTIDAAPYGTDAEAIGLDASGIAVEDLHVEAAGATDGILAGPAVASATIVDSSVTLGTPTAATVGIQLGDVFPASVTEPTGTFVVRYTTVTGPGATGEAGQEGILVAGASVTIANDTVSGFSAETTTTNGGNTYSSWFEDTQSVGVFAGCASGSAACSITGSSLSDNSIGIAYTLLTASDQSITPSSVAITGNTVSDSLAYGLVAEATGASGTTSVSDNSFDNAVSGAPAAFLLGAAFSVTDNTFVGTSTTGSNGAAQGQDSCATGTIGTASVEASDCFNPTTTVALNANFFDDASAPYWSATFPSNPSTSSELGGEIVAFDETGLVHGTSWTLTVGGQPVTVTAPQPIAADLANGSSSFSVHSIAGYRVNPAAGSITVSGSPVTVPIDFTLVDYLVTLHENGLPAETEWGVKINGSTSRSTTDTIAVYLPNGTYPYVPGAAGWSAKAGTAVVDGSSLVLQVNFTQAIYTVTFHATGLASGIEWWVNLTTMASYHSKTSTIRFTEANGTFNYIVVAHNSSSREHTAPGGAFAVVGAAVSVPVAFITHYPVTFRESALPSGTEWWVNVTGGASHSTSAVEIEFWALAGTYHFTVATADKDYAAKGGSFTIHRSGVARHLKFVKQLFEVTVDESGLPAGSSWCVRLASGHHCSYRTSLEFKLDNGSYAYTLTTRRAGYSAPGGTIVVAGSPVSKTVTFGQ